MGPQSEKHGARVELDRCQGCGRFIGPHDAVCGHCGRPCAAFIRSRAARFGITAQDCPHCLAGSGQPWVCVRCGAPLPVTGAVSKGTRLGLVCIRCGAALRGDAYCTCCGAPVRSRSISPSKRDKTLLAFAQYDSFLEQRDPNYVFRIKSTRKARVLLALLVIIAVHVSVIGTLFVIRNAVAAPPEPPATPVEALANFRTSGATIQAARDLVQYSKDVWNRVAAESVSTGHYFLALVQSLERPGTLSDPWLMTPFDHDQSAQAALREFAARCPGDSAYRLHDYSNINDYADLKAGGGSPFVKLWMSSSRAFSSLLTEAAKEVSGHLQADPAKSDPLWLIPPQSNTVWGTIVPIIYTVSGPLLVVTLLALYLTQQLVNRPLRRPMGAKKR